MEENKNTIAAATETTIDSIKTLMDAIGNDDELKQKLKDILLGKTSESDDDTKTDEQSGSTSESDDDTKTDEQSGSTSESSSEEQNESSGVDEDESEDDDNDEEDEALSETYLDDPINEDALTGIVIGGFRGFSICKRYRTSYF